MTGAADYMTVDARTCNCGCITVGASRRRQGARLMGWELQPTKQSNKRDKWKALLLMHEATSRQCVHERHALRGEE